MSGKRISALLICLSLTLILAGCSDKVKVKGKVTFPDGSPLTVGTVNFTNEQVSARGSLNEQGEYVISSTGTRDGLKKGKYKVVITQAMGMKDSTAKLKKVAGTEVGGMGTPINLIDEKFVDPETSGLEVNVEKAMTYDITVYAPGKAPGKAPK